MKIFKFMLGDIYYFFKNLSYLGVLFSPFSLPTLRIYFGKINVGVPYFLPRKWVKYTKQEAIEEAIENNVDEVEETTWNNEEDYQNYEPADILGLFGKDK